ncbi:6213_t:CDS:2, partial [Racocetra fulgida]
ECQSDVQKPGEPKEYSKNPEPKRESSRNDINISKTQRAEGILQEPEPKRELSREDVNKKPEPERESLEKKENNISVKKKPPLND